MAGSARSHIIAMNIWVNKIRLINLGNEDKSEVQTCTENSLENSDLSK